MCFYQEEKHIKKETSGVEESAVVVVEGTAVKEKIKEENMDTEDPLSVQGNYGALNCCRCFDNRY